MHTRLFMLMILSLMTTHLNAQWQPNGVAVCDTAGKQHVAANGILSDGAGGAYVAWDYDDTDHAYLQRFDSLGYSVWGEQWYSNQS